MLCITNKKRACRWWTPRHDAQGKGMAMWVPLMVPVQFGTSIQAKPATTSHRSLRQMKHGASTYLTAGHTSHTANLPALNWLAMDWRMWGAANDGGTADGLFPGQGYSHPAGLLLKNGGQLGADLHKGHPEHREVHLSLFIIQDDAVPPVAPHFFGQEVLLKFRVVSIAPWITCFAVQLPPLQSQKHWKRWRPRDS